jgi:hypothetical protein
MSKHTPGPWEIRHNLGSSGVIVGGVMRQYTNGEAKDQIVMVLGLQEDNGGAAAKEANARLIEAAPDLLEALKLARSIIGHPDDAHSKLIDAAIKKAEGL